MASVASRDRSRPEPTSTGWPSTETANAPSRRTSTADSRAPATPMARQCATPRTDRPVYYVGLVAMSEHDGRDLTGRDQLPEHLARRALRQSLGSLRNRRVEVVAGPGMLLLEPAQQLQLGVEEPVG